MVFGNQGNLAIKVTIPIVLRVLIFLFIILIKPQRNFEKEFKITSQVQSFVI